jgi:hypothetical protein
MGGVTAGARPTHTLFLDSVEEVKKFDAATHFNTVFLLSFALPFFVSFSNAYVVAFKRSNVKESESRGVQCLAPRACAHSFLVQIRLECS